jgi:CRP-like cAMP-binding protein
MDQKKHIEALLEELSPDELLALIEYIARRLRQSEERKPQPLYGIWRGKFPEDADIDATLKEVLNQWQEDFEELKQ